MAAHSPGWRWFGGWGDKVSCRSLTSLRYYFWLVFKELRMGVAMLQCSSDINHPELVSTPKLRVWSPTGPMAAASSEVPRPPTLLKTGYNMRVPAMS